LAWDEKAKREVTAIVIESTAEEDGNAIFDGAESRLCPRDELSAFIVLDRRAFHKGLTVQLTKTQ